MMNETYVLTRAALALLAATFTVASTLLFQFGHVI